jgi:hypothetical protein
MSLNNAEGARRGASSSRMPDTEASQLEKLQKAIGYARAQLRLKDEENAQLKEKDENEGKRNLAALSFFDALSKATEPQKRRRSKHS